MYSDHERQKRKDRNIQIAIDTEKKLQSFPCPATGYFPEKEMRVLRQQLKAGKNPEVSLEPQRTIAALAGEKDKYPDARVCLLNFANGTHPGGGWDSGANAQEETLCRASTLIRGLELQPSYYRENKENHRRYNNSIGTHNLLYSHNVHFFKNDDGEDLDTVYISDVLTLAAPNLGWNRPASVQDPQAYFKLIRNRLLGMTAILNQMNLDTVILGAWGCGAFKNDPEITARAFREILSFLAVPKVIFVIPEGPNYDVFKEVLFAQETGNKK